MSSFSNKSGVVIIFGINEENNFSIDGVYDLHDLQEKIANLYSDAMEPNIRIEALPMEYEGKNILAIKIEELEQSRKPCYYKPKGLKNGSYTRIGDRDDLMTDYEIYAIQSYKEHIIEDKRPNKSLSLEDLKENDLKKYLNKVMVNKSNFAKNSYEKNLKLCGIIDGNKNNMYPTLAGTLLFGEYPQAYYPQLFIACSVIPGLELGDTGSFGERFIDNKRVEGTIEEMLNDAMNFLRRNMKTRIIIDGNGKRENRPEYPLEALREAIANALIHRDYSSQMENAYISVLMYEDRIEILSPGSLYGSNKLEKLGSSNMLEARNPTIVRILEEKGSFLENRHSGIPTMKREMQKYGLPNPEFYNEIDSFRVIFRNGSGTQSETQSGTQSGTQSVTQINPKIVKKILEFCWEEPKTSKEIRDFLNISSKSYFSTFIIKPLIEKELLEYTNKNSINARNQKYITKRK